MVKLIIFVLFIFIKSFILCTNNNEPELENLNATQLSDDFDDFDEEEDIKCENNEPIGKLMKLWKEEKNYELSKNVVHFNETIERIIGLGKLMQKLLTSMKPMKKHLMEMFYEINLPNGCLESILHVINSMKRGKLWAFKSKDKNLIFSLILKFRKLFLEYPLFNFWHF